MKGVGQKKLDHASRILAYAKIICIMRNSRIPSPTIAKAAGLSTRTLSRIYKWCSENEYYQFVIGTRRGEAFIEKLIESTKCEV